MMKMIAKTSVTFQADDGYSLEIHHANRGDPYREGIDVVLTIENGDYGGCLFLEDHEARQLRDLLNRLYPAKRASESADDTQFVGMITDKIVERAAKAIERAVKQSMFKWTDEEFELWWNQDPHFVSDVTFWDDAFGHGTEKNRLLWQTRIALRAAFQEEAPRVSNRKDKPMTPNELAARRATMKALGWDECAATGQDHDAEDKPQADGCFYCRYCGAEMLPEETVNGSQLAQEAFAAAERFFEWASLNETMWTGWGEQTVPARAEWWRVKAGQALDALRECVECPPKGR